MKNHKLLADELYDREIQRMSQLLKFPQLEPGKQELRRALRRISESDGSFIHRLVSDVVDSDGACPTPAELIRRAGDMRALAPKSMGNPDCEKCGGSGFVHSVRRVNVKGVAPYDAEVSERCACVR